MPAASPRLVETESVPQSPSPARDKKKRSATPRDKWKRTRRTFYVVVIISLVSMLASVGRLHSHERAIQQQQSHIDSQVRESRRWLYRLLAVEAALLATNSYFVYRGVKFHMLLKRIHFRMWIDNIKARMPFVRATARVVNGAGRVVNFCAWPVRFPVRVVRQAHRQRAAQRAALLAKANAPPSWFHVAEVITRETQWIPDLS